MGDMAESFRILKEESKKKRAYNRQNSTEILQSKSVEFESKNCGAHLIVNGRDCLIDFWPGTGKFISRNGKKGRGVRNLLKLCRRTDETQTLLY